MNNTSNQHNTTTPKRLRTLLATAAIAATAFGATVVGGTGSAGAIVNGEATSITTTPWQVSIQNADGHFCGGTVIDATTVVSAAHCFEGESAAGVFVRAGVTDSRNSGGQDVRVTAITSHPEYARTEIGDVAVLRLATPLAFDDTVRAVELANRAELNGAQTALVSGWGDLSEQGGDGTTQLRSTTVPLVADQTCAASLGIDNAGEVCAGGTGADTCYGDSGGPLVVQTDDGPKLGGVTSWGEACGGATPGVYAEVPNYADFINANRAVAPGTDAQLSESSVSTQDADPAEAAEGDFDSRAVDAALPDVDEEPIVDHLGTTDEERDADEFDVEGDEAFDLEDSGQFADDFYDDEYDLADDGDLDDWTVEIWIDGEWFAVDTYDWTDAEWELIEDNILFE